MMHRSRDDEPLARAMPYRLWLHGAQPLLLQAQLQLPALRRPPIFGLTPMHRRRLRRGQARAARLALYGTWLVQLPPAQIDPLASLDQVERGSILGR